MKYILTSKAFEGEMMLEYSSAGMIKSFENNASLDESQLQYLVQRFPMTRTEMDGLLQRSSTLVAKLVPSDLSFEAFWNKYSYKVGNLARVKKLWDKMGEVDRAECLESIPAYDKWLIIKKGLDKVYPETYLSQQRYKINYWQLIARG